MTNAKRIKAALKKRPHWSAKRVAEHLGLAASVVSVTASRNKIKFMSRRDLEDLIDG